MNTISIVTSSKNYNVFIGNGVIEELDDFIVKNFKNCTKIMIFTDETVEKLHLASLQQVISSIPYVTYTVPAGEKAKTFDVFYDCLTYALQENLDRKSLVLALGGGAVGDLAGFVAASYMRGIPFIQVPTTILAHDSAVGGKVAINHPLGKNMIGVFNQPEAVFFDTSFINTLPVKEIKSGFGEVIKHALISDDIFYQQLLQIDALEEVSDEEWSVLLEKGIKVKSSFVEQDEKEANVRAYLNFGHTLGHALEAEMGYGNMTHGEAVVIGMVFALKLSQKKLNLEFSLRAFTQWLEKLGYSIEIPETLNVDHLIDRMKKDKKSINGTIHFVLLEKIGSPISVSISEEEMKSELEMFKDGE